MLHVVGIDEAGYGPNLGPLVITATHFIVTSTDTAESWQSRFRQSWYSGPSGGRPRVPIDDSKRVYSSSSGIGSLESLVLAVVNLAAGRSGWGASAGRAASVAEPGDFQTLCRMLGATSRLPPWHVSDGVKLPLSADRDEILALRSHWCQTETSSQVQLQSLRSTVLFPREYNTELKRWDNKASLLSSHSLALVRSVSEHLPRDACVRVWCDKHGGRQRYAPFLFGAFGGALVDVVEETPALSHYRMLWKDRRIEIRFLKGGESQLPVALASMVSKYVREVSMAAFNHYWEKQVPGIRPTAGYPVDARRFREETADARRRLAMPDDLFWRER